MDCKETRNRNLCIGHELMLAPLLRIRVQGAFPLEQAAEVRRLIDASHVQGKLALETGFQTITAA